MEFNNSTFEALRYGNNTELKSNTHYLSSAGTPIVIKSKLRDLGVIMNDDSTFKDNLIKITESAKQQSTWILRTFKSRDKTVMLTLWKSLILPILEYCSQLWCPVRVGEIQRIESIQWSFLRKIKQIKKSTGKPCHYTKSTPFNEDVSGIA